MHPWAWNKLEDDVEKVGKDFRKKKKKNRLRIKDEMNGKILSKMHWRLSSTSNHSANPTNQPPTQTSSHPCCNTTATGTEQRKFVCICRPLCECMFIVWEFAMAMLVCGWDCLKNIKLTLKNESKHQLT